MTPVELSGDAKERIKGMAELRSLVNELIAYQLEDFPDADIAAKQAELNAAYDAFSTKFGLLNDRKNGRLFEDDSSYYLLCSLENLDENGKKQGGYVYQKDHPARANRHPCGHSRRGVDGVYWRERPG